MKSRSPRFGTRRPAFFYRIDEKIRAELEDVSECGAFVHTHALLPVNGVVDLHLSLPDGTRVTIESRVAHCLTEERARQIGRRGGIGFAFLHPPAQIGPSFQGYLHSVRSGDGVSTHTQRCAVLIACQEPALALRLRSALAQSFGLVQVATSHSRACFDFDQRSWDLVVIDESLDRLAFVEYCGAGRSAPAPIIYVTSTVSETQRVRALSMGACEILQRPFLDRELLLRAERLVGGRQADLSGQLSAVGATSVISLLHFERRSGLLSLHGEQWSVHVGVRKGAVVSVEGPEGPAHIGLLMEALDWSRGQFEFRSVPIEGLQERATDLSAVLMQHARMRDEQT